MRYAKYARKARTGALWGYIRPGVWIKLSCGNKKLKTKPVGYYGFNFYPENNPNKWSITHA